MEREKARETTSSDCDSLTDPRGVSSNLEEDEGCVIKNEADEDEDYEAGFLELESGHEDEDEDEEDDEDDDDGEVDDVEAQIDRHNAGAAGGSSEDELMGNALEALPELHSPGHEKYELASNSSAAQDEEAVLDAVSKRTRARYSLTDMSLDQLETFLQESDEDDYFQNVDDEEEYRKFLASVAQPGAVEAVHDQEDEEDDADFEIEIQEALESDCEQIRKEEPRKRKGGRRPETREQRRERLQNKERAFGFARAPLRPLLPYHVVPSLSSSGETGTITVEFSYRQPQGGSNFQPSATCFSPFQLGQLYCLIHEHVQLLVQVFSLCILEPSRQQVAIDTHRMLMELVARRDCPSLHNIPFPEFCFRRPYVRSSADDHSCVVSQAASCWTPSVTQPVYSVLSVAPLDLVKEYLEDVAVKVQDYTQRHVRNGSFNSRCDREPLFPLPEDTSPQSKKGSLSQMQVKKTMAAILVENTKRQIIALVPKGIVTAASRFIPFFNPALFPHKPPPPATANRLLFTDAEDELLAMGLMTFNTDWKAIQERFLPTKSTHQIFVRQKNRSSSRAPENSIKSIRRMKNSLLTLEERDSIQEALKCFKYDWNKVWQHVVPHRDPALLPRQWRTALGTQKSYKSDELSKGKRRLHEASKRRMKATQKNGEEGDEVTNVDDDGGDCEELHIHEAFLSDWREEARLTNLKSKIHLQAQRPGKSVSGASPTKRLKCQTVKLAPGLPSLNLPPHVRVISQPIARPDSAQRRDAVAADRSSSQSVRSVHPLLLRPSYSSPPTAIRPPSSAQSSQQRHLPAFHPFFGVPSGTYAPCNQAVVANAGTIFHPLLQKPLESYMRSTKEVLESRGSIFDDKSTPRKNSGSPVENDADASKPDVMDHLEVYDTRDETEAEHGVEFECEEIDDSDECLEPEKRGEDVEFEEEEIGSESESDSKQESGVQNRKASESGVQSCKASFAVEVDEEGLPFVKNDKPSVSSSTDKEADVNAIEAARVLTKFLKC